MNTKVITVLVADDNVDQCHQISSLIENEDNMTVVDVAYDGMDAYNKIIKYKPDIAIIDFIMPELDGLGILEKLYMDVCFTINTKIIILSPIQNEAIARLCNDSGACYYILKPFNVNSLLKRISEFTSTTSNNQINTNGENITNIKNENIKLQKIITKVILELGIPANIRGYHFIRDAIIFCIKDFELLNYVTKELYPSIAKKHNTTPYKVERGMRHAIEVAWTKGNKEILDEVFVHTVNQSKGKPTNSQFIALLVDRYKLEHQQFVEIYK